MFFLSAGDLHEHGGSAGPGGSREGTQPRALGGRWDPQGQGPVGIQGTTSRPWAVLPSRTASIHLHIPWQSEMPSAAGAPVPALLPASVPHQAGHRSHLGCIRYSMVSTTPSSHPHPSAWHRTPASPCSLLVLLGLRNTNTRGSAAPSSRRGEARSTRHVGAGRFAGAECFSFQVTQALLLLRG